MTAPGGALLDTTNPGFPRNPSLAPLPLFYTVYSILACIYGRGRALPPVRWLFDLYCACVLRERDPGNQPNNVCGGFAVLRPGVLYKDARVVLEGGNHRCFMAKGNRVGRRWSGLAPLTSIGPSQWAKSSWVRESGTLVRVGRESKGADSAPCQSLPRRRRHASHSVISVMPVCGAAGHGPGMGPRPCTVTWNRAVWHDAGPDRALTMVGGGCLCGSWASFL